MTDSLPIRLALATATCLVLVVVLIGAAAAGVAQVVLSPILDLIGGGSSGSTSVTASATALDDIPANYLAVYEQAAATCPGLPWTVLAGIGRAESDHGQATDQVSPAGALGPMQFLPATFAAYDHPVPPGGANPPSPWNPTDAIYAAARMLCDDGAKGGKDTRAAIFSYNHATSYVDEVLKYAQDYTGATTTTVAGANKAATIAIAFTREQIGKPYVWGATGPNAWDCSGLVQAAYKAAGISIPRVAQDQYDAGPHVPAGAVLEPGDLVFYGSGPNEIDHVGIYLGGRQMIDAPKPGLNVRQEAYRWSGDTYVGATRPER
jgi:cell wall-associated NlpC family hydrolase